MPITNHQTREAWLEARKSLITASDAAIICNKIPTPYKDRVTLWAEKLGMREPDPPNDLMLAFFFNDTATTEIYTEKYGIDLFNHGDYTMHTHPDIPWLGATLDREEVGTGRPVEIKNLHQQSEKRYRHGGGYLPHECQLQIQMFVTGRDSGVLFMEIGGVSWLKKEYALNQKFIDKLLPQLETFHDCMVNKTEPEYDFWSEAITKTFETLHPDDNGQTVYLDEIADTVGEWDRIHEERLALEKKVRELKKLENPLTTKIKGAILDNTYGDAGHIAFELKRNKGGKRILKKVKG
jgi:putative phage-type endonuclease